MGKWVRTFSEIFAIIPFTFLQKNQQFLIGNECDFVAINWRKCCENFTEIGIFLWENEWEHVAIIFSECGVKLLIAAFHPESSTTRWFDQKIMPRPREIEEEKVGYFVLNLWFYRKTRLLGERRIFFVEFVFFFSIVKHVITTMVIHFNW